MQNVQEMPQFTYEELHESLWRYARWKASCDGNRGHWMLEKEDLYSEYLLVMFKCYERYSSNDGITLEELMAICKSAMRNKFSSMLSYCFQTHRRTEKESKDLDDVNSHTDIPGGIDPSSDDNEKSVFSEIASNLNSFDAKVLDAILGNNERVGKFLELHRRRLSFCLVSCDVRINSHIVACALCEDETEVEESFTRIKDVLQKRNEFKFFPVISSNELIFI